MGVLESRKKPDRVGEESSSLVVQSSLSVNFEIRIAMLSSQRKGHNEFVPTTIVAACLQKYL